MKNFNTNDFNYEEVCNFMANDFFHYSGSVKKSKSMKFLIDGETYRLSVSVKERDYIKIEKKGENGYETIKEKKARINQITLLVAQDMLWIVLNNIVAVKEAEGPDAECEDFFIRNNLKIMNMEKILNDWTKFAKDYAEAVADADDVTFNYRDREYVFSFEDDYDSAKHSFISMKNLEMGEETNKYLEEAYSISDFVKHYYSYAVEKGYIKDYEIDYNNIISVEAL